MSLEYAVPLEVIGRSKSERIGRLYCCRWNRAGASSAGVIFALWRRRDYGQDLLLYGARSPLDLLYRVELEQWSKQYDVEVLVTVDRVIERGKGTSVLFRTSSQYIKLDARATMAMVCGPEIMMQYTDSRVLRCGVPPEQIYLSMERNMKSQSVFAVIAEYRTEIHL